MRIQEILDQLPASEIQSMTFRFERPASQLESYLAEESIFTNNYRAISRRMRQLYDNLFHESLEVSINELRDKRSILLNDLKMLQERMLLFILPSSVAPEKIVVPLEYSFIKEVGFHKPQSLILALRNYRDVRMHRVARYYKVEPRKPFTLYAAEVYQRILETSHQEKLKLSPEEHELLHSTLLYGGQIQVQRFRKKYDQQVRLFHPTQQFTLDDLLGVRQLDELNPLQKLFVKCFLIPIFDANEEIFQSLAIPEEIFKIIASEFNTQKELNKAEIELEMLISVTKDEPRLSIEFPLENIKKILLLVENIQPRMTQDWMPFKSDYKKMLAIVNQESEKFIFLFKFAIWSGLLQTRDGRFETSPSCLEYMKLMHSEHYLLARNFLRTTAFEQEVPESNLNVIHLFLIKILKHHKNQIINITKILNYCSIDTEFRQLFEEYEHYDHAFTKKIFFILRRYYWLGLIEANDEFTQIRLSPAGQYALCGALLPHFQPEILEEKFLVQPNLEIIAFFNMPFDILLNLARIAMIVTIDLTIQFQLNKSQLVNAVQNVMSIPYLQQFLEQHSKTPLPQTVLYLFKELEDKENEISLIPISGYLQFKDAEIQTQAKILLKEYIYDLPVGNKLLIKSGVDLHSVEQQLQRKGFFIKSFMENEVKAIKEENRLQSLLEMLEPPAFNQNELNFSNPAATKDEIQKLLFFAIEHQLKVKIEYDNETFSNSIRQVRPNELSENILKGYCYNVEMDRNFRIDRIRRAELIR